MRVIAPVALTTAMLTADSVPENDAPEWSAGTTYSAGALVMKAATHRLYQSVAAGNAGNDPAATLGTKWTDAGPTNRWAMFDQVVGTLTSATGSIALTLAPGPVAALAVLDTNADSVRVQVSAGGATLYDRTMFASVSGGVIADWYAYFTAPVGRLKTITFLDLPQVAGQIAVTITGPDRQGAVTVGTLLVGNVSDLGSTATGGSVGMISYSLKTTDQFGVTSIVPRAWSKQSQLKTMIDTAAVDGIQRTLVALRDTPALWLGEDGFDSLAIYGFFKEFQVDLALANISYLSLTVEGLT